MSYFLFILTSCLMFLSGLTLLVRHVPLNCRVWWAWLGLGATMLGDFFLVYKGYGMTSPGFLGGIAGFLLAQCLWAVWLWQPPSPYWKLWLIALVLIYGTFYFGWVFPRLDSWALRFAMLVYAAASILNLAKGHGILWTLAIGALLFSDTMIAFRSVLDIHWAGTVVGPTYLLALMLTAAAIATIHFQR